MARRIKKARIKFISLCPRGKNRMPTILKEDGAFEVQLLSKGLSERGELHAVVYAPEFRDSEGDIASADVVKDMLYTAAKEGVSIDLRHDGVALEKDRAYIAEQFIIQKNDPRFSGLSDYDGVPVDPTGGWGVVIKIDDPELRALYKKGEWQGVSMGGVAEVVQEKEDEGLAERIVRALEKKLNPEEEPMALTDEDLKKVAKAAAEAAVAAVQATKEEPPAPPKTKPTGETKPKAPVFKGDPTNPEDVKTHRENVRKHRLEQRLAKATSEKEIDEILKEIESGSTSTEESDELKKAKAEAAAAQEKLRKIQGSSRQSTTESVAGQQVEIEGVSKEDQENFKAGYAMAAWANKQRGY